MLLILLCQDWFLQSTVVCIRPLVPPGSAAAGSSGYWVGLLRMAALAQAGCSICQSRPAPIKLKMSPYKMRCAQAGPSRSAPVRLNRSPTRYVKDFIIVAIFNALQYLFQCMKEIESIKVCSNCKYVSGWGDIPILISCVGIIVSFCQRWSVSWLD